MHGMQVLATQRTRVPRRYVPCVVADRSQFFKDLTAPFYGANRPGATVSQGLRDAFWLQGMMAGFPAAYLCIKAFSETDIDRGSAEVRHPDSDPVW